MPRLYQQHDQRISMTTAHDLWGWVFDMHDGMQVAQLVGRDSEQEAVRAALAAGARRPAGLLLRGEAGIGKSALWRHGLALAREQQRTVLVARPAAEERDIACSGLVDLLGGQAQGTVGGVAVAESDTPLARGRALLDEVRRLARERPLVIAVDDTPWLDDASAQALRYTLRRLETEPVTVLATSRRADVERLDLPTTLAAHPLQILDVEPLGMEEIREVLAGCLDRVSQPTLHRLHTLSAGNPLHAMELGRCLRARPDGRRVIVLPASLREALDRRVAQVGPRLRALVDILAVGGPQPAGPLELVVDVPVGPAVDEGRRAGLLAVDERERVRFAHPLLAAAADGRIGPADRRGLHARLAAVVPDRDDRARHHALATRDPDPNVAAEAEAAAHRARRRGAGATAVALSEQAVRLTDSGDPERIRRMLQLVDHLAYAGEIERALALIDDVIAELPEGPQRAEALVRRFYVGSENCSTAESDLRRAVVDAGDDRTVRARVLDLHGWVLGMYCGDLEAGLTASREAVALCDDRGSATALLAEARVTHMETLAGGAAPGAMTAVVTRALGHDAPTLGGCPSAWLAKQLLWDGQPDGSRELVHRLLAEGVRTGNELERPYRLYDLALAELTAGRLPEAGAAVRDGLMAAADASNADAEGWLYYPQAWWHALAGRPSEAREQAARLLDVAGRPGGLPSQARAHRVLGTLALAEGDPVAAADELTAAVDLLRRWGVAHPGLIPVLPDAIEAAAAAGDLSTAGRLLTRLEDQVKSRGTAWGTAIVRRSRAVVALARGEADQAADELMWVATSLSDLGHAIEAARARLLSGQALLRASRRSTAAEVLATAYQEFGVLGAVLWEERARAEVERAAAGRTTRSLTPTERAVVRLVASGRRNREVAAEMFLSVATVEAHLTRTYRKLGVRSRSELVGLVVRGDLELDLQLAG